MFWRKTLNRHSSKPDRTQTRRRAISHAFSAIEPLESRLLMSVSAVHLGLGPAAPVGSYGTQPLLGALLVNSTPGSPNVTLSTTVTDRNATAKSDTATINWGDGTSSSESLASVGGNQFTISDAAHTYPVIGTYTITVSVSDSATAPVTASTVVDNDADDTIAKVNASNDQVALGQSVARTMNPANDVDMVRFTVVAGQKVGFEVDPRNGSMLDTDLRLFDANGDQLAINNRAGSGAASASAFSYLTYTFSQAGNYYIAVSLAPNINYNPLTGAGKVNGGTTGDYTLTLTNLGVAPQITASPEATTVGDSAAATFTAAATGSPAPTVQWYVSTDNGSSYTPVSGATSPTLSIASADQSQNGYLYRAVFTNSVGSVTTAAAKLTVYYTGAYQSGNWSGYLAQPFVSPNGPVAGEVTGVTGSWAVPAVTGGSSPSYSCTWVGIDGFAGVTAGGSTVEQIGTEQDFVNGHATYYAWWEMCTGSASRQQLISGFSVSPGDRISADVMYNPTTGAYTLSMQDLTTGQNYSTLQQSALATAGTPLATHSCAEWVEEATMENGAYQPIADFGQVTFTDATATINGVTGPIDSPTWQSNPIDLTENTAGGRDALPGAITDTTSSSGFEGLPGPAPGPAVTRSTSSSFTVTYGGILRVIRDAASSSTVATAAGSAGSPDATAGSATGASDSSLRTKSGWAAPTQQTRARRVDALSLIDRIRFSKFDELL